MTEGRGASRAVCIKGQDSPKGSFFGSGRARRPGKISLPASEARALALAKRKRRLMTHY